MTQMIAINKELVREEYNKIYLAVEEETLKNRTEETPKFYDFMCDQNAQLMAIARNKTERLVRILRTFHGFERNGTNLGATLITYKGESIKVTISHTCHAAYHAVFMYKNKIINKIIDDVEDEAWLLSLKIKENLDRLEEHLDKRGMVIE